MQELIDRLPFPLNVLVFGVGFVGGAIVITGIVYGASLTLEGYALNDKLKRVLDGIQQFFTWFLEIPGTGEVTPA